VGGREGASERRKHCHAQCNESTRQNRAYSSAPSFQSRPQILEGLKLPHSSINGRDVYYKCLFWTPGAAALVGWRLLKYAGRRAAFIGRWRL